MKNTIQFENGYALLLTLLLTILFAGLGVSVVVYSSNGVIKNDTRKEIVQSNDLSTKGIDRLSNQINSDIKKAMDANKGLPRSTFIAYLESTLNKYKCVAPSETTDYSSIFETPTGNYHVCIEAIENFEEYGIINELKRLVTFRSIGTSNEASNTTRIKIAIGAESVPDTMKYAIGTNMSNPDNPQGGEGNLVLNGGVSIQGDLKVEGNLITYNKGFVRSGTTYYSIPSVLPQISGVNPNKRSRLFLGGKGYNLVPTEKFDKNNNNGSTFNYDKHVAGSILSPPRYSQKNNLDVLFNNGFGPTVINTEPIISPIGITDKESYSFERTVNNRVEVFNGNIEGENRDVMNPVFYNYKCISYYSNNTCKTYGTTRQYNDTSLFTFEGTNIFNRFSTQQDVIFSGTNTFFNNSAYFGGDVTVQGNATNSITGNIYVAGDLTINAKDFKSNVIFYVKGNVFISESVINGIQLLEEKSGSLIIFAKGNISLSNNSVNLDTPSNIQGFFYSEGNLEIYGVGSNVVIKGGLSAKRIVLNAIRGRAKNSSFTDSYAVASSYYESETKQKTLSRDKSRLQVIYDTNIISTYSDLKQPEPRIYALDKPFETERTN